MLFSQMRSHKLYYYPKILEFLQDVLFFHSFFQRKKTVFYGSLCSTLKLEIKGGVLKDKVLDADAIMALAKLPSREVLLGQLLSVINEVPTSFVRVLAEVPRSLVNVLTAIKDQKEEKEAA